MPWSGFMTLGARELLRMRVRARVLGPDESQKLHTTPQTTPDPPRARTPGPPARGERGPGGHGLSCESETERCVCSCRVRASKQAPSGEKNRLYIIAKDEGRRTERVAYTAYDTPHPTPLFETLPGHCRLWPCEREHRTEANRPGRWKTILQDTVFVTQTTRKHVHNEHAAIK